MDNSAEYGAPISNLPPLAWLSGLNLGSGEAGLSGDQQPSMGGGAPGTVMPGMEGGLGLDALSQLLQAQGATGGEGSPGNAASMLQGIGGTIGQNTLAQGGPGYNIAGGGITQPTQQQTGGGYTAGQTQDASIDPMAIIKAALGLTQKGIGLAGKLGGETGYDAGGTSQLGQTGAINPSGYSLTQPGAAPEGSPEALAKFFGGEFGGRELLNDPTLMQLFTSGGLNGLLGSANENNLADLLSGGGFSLGGQSPENIFAAPGGSAGFSLGGDTSLNASLGGAMPDTNWAGAAGSGVGGLLGLLNVYQGLQGGNAQQGIGGGLQTLGSLTSLLQSSPQLASMLGVGSGALGGLSAGLGAAGGALGGLGGVQGLLGGIQSLASGGDIGDALPQLASGGLGIYGGLSTLMPSTFPAISQMLAQALAQVAPQIASALGITGGTTAATAGGTAAGSASGGAAGSAAGAAVAGPLAMIAGPLIVGQALNMVSEMQQAASMKEAMKDLKGFTSSLPGHMAAWQQAPGLLQQIQATNDPAEAARLFEDLQKIQAEFQGTGTEQFLKAGGTRVAGGRDLGSGAFAEFEQGPGIMKALAPFMQASNYGQLLAQDKAAAGGMTLPGARDAQSYALSLGGPQFNEAYRPAAMLGSSQPGHGELLKLLDLPIFGQATQGVDPNAPVHQSVINLLGRFEPKLLGGHPYTNQDIQNWLGGAGANVMNTLRNDFDVYKSPLSGGVGNVDRNLTAQLAALQPGGLEQGLRGLLTQGGWQSDNPFFNMGGMPAPAPPPPVMPGLTPEGTPGLMPMLQGNQQPGGLYGRDEELKRMLFAQYGLA